MQDPVADSYGGVLISGGGKVLLREPTSHYGGYVWTFAKGRVAPGETPRQSAIREVFEETGYRARILDLIPKVFSGTTVSTAFFIMEPAHPPEDYSNETQQILWATFDEARTLIAQTKTKIGRQRDLQVLAMAEKWWGALSPAMRPAVQPEDWSPLLDMPQQRIRLPLALRFGAEAMARIRRGFLPSVMEDKWFLYFSGQRLRIHRSWTGMCIYDLPFIDDGSSRASTVEVVANRDPEQYSNTDEQEDLACVRYLIDTLLINRED